MGPGRDLPRAAAGVLLAALLAGACSDGPDPSGRTTAETPSTHGAGPSTGSAGDPVEPSYSDWELGASPLPLRPDGLGEMRRTPAPLRERRYPSLDRLPPPPDGRFRATVGPVPPDVRRRSTWRPACPVSLDRLRYLTVSFRGFDGRAHTGELMVAAGEADDVVSVFRTLFVAGFPIEEMRVPTARDLEAHPTGDGNNTAGFVCRPAVGAASWSAHAYGLAIDVNPFMNPYHRGDVVLPELASSYLRRGWSRPGMIGPDSVVVREFARIGWSWGGAWTSLKDYQHFSATGR